jgi:hypothetical protein
MRTGMTATLAALALACGSASAGDHGKIQWGSSHDKALAEAKESGKAIVIYFTADW